MPNARIVASPARRSVRNTFITRKCNHWLCRWQGVNVSEEPLCYSLKLVAVWCKIMTYGCVGTGCALFVSNTGLDFSRAEMPVMHRKTTREYKIVAQKRDATRDVGRDVLSSGISNTGAIRLPGTRSPSFDMDKSAHLETTRRTLLIQNASFGPICCEDILRARNCTPEHLGFNTAHPGSCARPTGIYRNNA